ncbi:MAG: 16S rRNA (uracil(1498)-N(3))-methyltransferase [Desulfovibrionaceae bacterium]|nr:16S rRNA (uracil(1498)-N(3))-methyltransferase [Desulfovibrionaceae bacterium]
MSNTPAFYLPKESWNEEVLLEGQEAFHLHHVLRIREGSTVMLLDGCGRSGLFTVLNIYTKAVRLKQQSVNIHERPKSLPIMALALSKAVRRGFFMEKAAELGAAAVWLWMGANSQGKVNNNLGLTCQRQIIAGAKQCQNPWFPDVRIFPNGITDLIAAASNIPQRILPWELEDSSQMLPIDALGCPGPTIYVIGPEGGFSNEELKLLDDAKFTKVSLGNRILRCETAAVLCLGLHFWAANLKKA